MNVAQCSSVGLTLADFTVVLITDHQLIVVDKKTSFGLIILRLHILTWPNVMVIF